jgi:hypothetical protein
MPEHESRLTEADRKAIADIRRELDAEFGPLENAVPLDVREEREEADTARAGIAEPAAYAPPSRPGIVAAFVAGLLLGAIAGGVGTIVWLLLR